MLAKAVLLLLLVTACLQEMQRTDLSNYFPNTVGDFWDYDVTDSAQSLPNNPSPPQHYSVKVTITGTKILMDGKPAAIWQYQYPWGNDTNFVRITGDTLKIFSLTYSRSLDDLNYPRILFILPFQVNKRWNGPLLNIDSLRVISQSNVTVPFYYHSFTNCFEIYHHYIGPNTELNDYYWFKPKIGMVTIRNKDHKNGPTLYRTWNLKNYHTH